MGGRSSKIPREEMAKKNKMHTVFSRNRSRGGHKFSTCMRWANGGQPLVGSQAHEGREQPIRGRVDANKIWRGDGTCVGWGVNRMGKRSVLFLLRLFCLIFRLVHGGWGRGILVCIVHIRSVGCMCVYIYIYMLLLCWVTVSRLTKHVRFKTTAPRSQP